MAESVLAAVRTGPSKTEIREYPMPDIPTDAALMKMEVGGICGTDVKLYKHPPNDKPTIMGHENIGVIAKAGREFTQRKGFKEGDLVFVEHYVSCGKCEWCHSGQYRHCENTNWRTNPDAIRYGYTSAEKAPHLWGGFAQYVYLPWNAVIHHVPKGVTPELAGLVTPMANGVEWSLFDGNVGYNSTVLIQGPGQQGLSQTVICKQAGASLIIVTGTAKDKARMEFAKKLGADYVIDVTKEDPLYEAVSAGARFTPAPPPPSPGLDLRTAVPAEPFRPATEPVEPVTPASGPAPAIPASAEPVTRASGPAGAPPVAELDPEQVEADLAAVDAALERIDRGAYGRCEVCHVVLDDHVLAADPTVGACPAHIHLTPVAVTA